MQDRQEEAARQLAIVKAHAPKHLINMMKKGDEESKWRSARCLVQVSLLTLQPHMYVCMYVRVCVVYVGVCVSTEREVIRMTKSKHNTNKFFA